MVVFVQRGDLKARLHVRECFKNVEILAFTTSKHEAMELVNNGITPIFFEDVGLGEKTVGFVLEKFWTRDEGDVS